MEKLKFEEQLFLYEAKYSHKFLFTELFNDFTEMLEELSLPELI